MNEWTTKAVLEVAATSIWVPAGAEQVVTDEYHLVRYPDRFVDPTWPTAQVAWSRTNRDVSGLIDEVTELVRDWGFDQVGWWISGASTPADTENELRARGGALDEILEVLSYDLGMGPPTFRLPDDVTVELVDDERKFRAASLVASAGWGLPVPDETELACRFEDVMRDLLDWSGFRVVAFVVQQPVSTGGCTLAGPVAHLWGAVTLPVCRNRGGYQGVLAERMRLAAEHGATLALVKGRVETSGPILRRCGFTRHGEERRYRLELRSATSSP